jgi:hypothetical protein
MQRIFAHLQVGVCWPINITECWLGYICVWGVRWSEVLITSLHELQLEYQTVIQHDEQCVQPTLFIRFKISWRWYVTIIMDIWTSSMVLFFIWNNVSEAGLCLRPQVKSLLGWSQSIERLPGIISWAQLSRFFFSFLLEARGRVQSPKRCCK